MSLKIQNVEAILACDTNNGISKDSIIPWKSKTDMKFFKNKTTNNIVIMGSKTLLSLPESMPLNNRKNIIITNDIDKYFNLYKNCSNEITFVNLNQAINIMKSNTNKMIYIIGGNQIFNQLMPYCSKIWLTRIKTNYNCDLIFDYDISTYTKEVIYEDPELEIMCLT